MHDLITSIKRLLPANMVQAFLSLENFWVTIMVFMLINFVALFAVSRLMTPKDRGRRQGQGAGKG